MATPQSSTGTSDPQSVLERLKCCRCTRTVAKVTPGQVLRPGAKLQIKCPHCNAFSYLVGVEDV